MDSHPHPPGVAPPTQLLWGRSKFPAATTIPTTQTAACWSSPWTVANELRMPKHGTATLRMLHRRHRADARRHRQSPRPARHSLSRGHLLHLSANHAGRTLQRQRPRARRPAHRAPRRTSPSPSSMHGPKRSISSPSTPSASPTKPTSAPPSKAAASLNSRASSATSHRPASAPPPSSPSRSHPPRARRPSCPSPPAPACKASPAPAKRRRSSRPPPPSPPPSPPTPSPPSTTQPWQLSGAETSTWIAGTANNIQRRRCASVPQRAGRHAVTSAGPAAVVFVTAVNHDAVSGNTLIYLEQPTALQPRWRRPSVFISSAPRPRSSAPHLRARAIPSPKVLRTIPDRPAQLSPAPPTGRGNTADNATINLDNAYSGLNPVASGANAPANPVAVDDPHRAAVHLVLPDRLCLRIEPRPLRAFAQDLATHHRQRHGSRRRLTLAAPQRTALSLHPGNPQNHRLRAEPVAHRRQSSAH